MSEANGNWKRLFFLLLNNNQPDDKLPHMWAQFKGTNLQKCELDAAIENIKNTLKEPVKERLHRILSDEKVTAAKLLNSMKADSDLEDDFWYQLFSWIRDTESHPIHEDKKVPILEGGQIKYMSMDEIEERFISENPRILTSVTSVPDQIISTVRCS